MIDTIFALSSGPTPAGIAVIRLSGPGTTATVKALFGRLPQERVASYGSFCGAEGGRIDSGLAVYFPGPQSFTGEDVAEFHLHGSRAVVARMLAELARRPGLRSAEQGEFARRAFLNGKIDLTAAEALADLIEADTEAQRRFALLNSGGGQRKLYEDWRSQLIGARALLEAELDFSDQEDVPGSVSHRVREELAGLARSIETHLEGFGRAEILRDGFDVVIVGPPNAGKSSLLNALARRDVALVSDEPGTTRDLIEVALDLDGMKVRLTDTAGIREGAGKVEALGIERARARARDADLVLQLHDLSSGTAVERIPGALLVGSKLDLGVPVLGADICISAATGAGLLELLDEIAARARDAVGNVADILPARSRHVELLERSLSSIREAMEGFDGQTELQAEALRRASMDIGRITGQVDVEDILDVIFSRFCIGK
ncbi:MAG: tRNA uridine-5-carboxymethylaminomethyl(34) synthesis GTPase MnmE [Rhizobiaceae bacterium]|nr:tRNA uridine-5-carboxymethylaminomethyl(34) synthesis GTPase MnmE [Rhizobiaceae bacterium]